LRAAPSLSNLNRPRVDLAIAWRSPPLRGEMRGRPPELTRLRFESRPSRRVVHPIDSNLPHVPREQCHLALQFFRLLTRREPSTQHALPGDFLCCTPSALSELDAESGRGGGGRRPELRAGLPRPTLDDNEVQSEAYRHTRDHGHNRASIPARDQKVTRRCEEAGDHDHHS